MRDILFTEKKKDAVLYVILILILGFIWGQSCAKAEASTEESRFFTEKIVRPVIRAIAGESVAEKVSDTLVRKIAHVVEYTVLGVMLGFLTRKRNPGFWLVLLLGLATAFLDETIQIFTGRGSMIADIWIDLIGVTLGGLIVLPIRKKNA